MRRITLTQCRKQQAPVISVPNALVQVVHRALHDLPLLRHATGVGNRRVGFAGCWRVGPAFVPFRTAGERRERFRFFVPRP